MTIKALRHDSEQCQHVKENKYGNNAVFTHWIIAVFLEIGTKWSAQSRTRGMWSGLVPWGKSSQLHELKWRMERGLNTHLSVESLPLAAASQTKFKKSLFILRTSESILDEPYAKQCCTFWCSIPNMLIQGLFQDLLQPATSSHQLAKSTLFWWQEFHKHPFINKVANLCQFCGQLWARQKLNYAKMTFSELSEYKLKTNGQ